MQYFIDRVLAQPMPASSSSLSLTNLILSVLWACATPLAMAAPEPIRIGMVNAQSGLSAGLGQGMHQGISAVFAEINAQGGIDGRRLELLIADDRYEPDLTVQETLRLVQQEEVIALLGFVGTPTTNAALPLAREMGVAMVAPFTGAMSLRSPPTPEVFNLRASYDDETEALVERLLTGGTKSIGVAYQNDGFGMAVLAGVERALQRRGLHVVATGSFARNSQAVTSAVAKLVDAGPDAIVIAAPYRPTATLVHGLRAAGSKASLATVSFVGTDELLPLLGAAGDGLLISQVVPPLTGGPLGGATRIERQCRRMVAKHTGIPLGYINFEGCIGAMVLVEALRRCAPEFSNSALLQSLGELKLSDFGGLDIDFTNGRRQAMGHVFLTEVRSGLVVPVGADSREPSDGQNRGPSIRALVDGTAAHRPAH